MPDSLISNHSAYVASLRGCPPSPDRLSVLAGMRSALAAILATVSVVLKFSGDAPKFPFWGALGIAAGLFLLFVFYTWIVELIAPKVKE
jgi:hypothetical protein